MDNSRLSTPVALLIFNRPDTTERVFEAIRAARPTKLLVVADGPRPDRHGEAERCSAARAVIERVDWDCQVFTNFANSNLGCKLRVASGLDWVFDTVEEAIILEDDCVPHADFFPFCAALLEKYRMDERVMMIGGTNYMLHLDIPESYFFSRYFAIWGWATWRRAWALYDINMPNWETYKAQKTLRNFYSRPDMLYYFTAAFDAAYYDQIDTWDLQWFYCCLFNNGLSAVPRVNLISNIGLEGSHTDRISTHSNFFKPVFPLDPAHLRHPVHVFTNMTYDNLLFTRNIKAPFRGRVTRRLRLLRQKLPF